MRFFTVLLVVATIASAALAVKVYKVHEAKTHCSSWYNVKANDTYGYSC